MRQESERVHAVKAPETATLLVTCRDRPGIVAGLSSFVFEHGGNILAADQHSDVESGRFYMRLVWDTSGFALDRPATAEALRALARGRSPGQSMEWTIHYSDRRQRIAILVSKTPHCLYDLLQAKDLDDLGGDVVGVISNHEDLRPVASHFDVPYSFVPMATSERERSEAEMQAILEREEVDLVVLARYMQVLSDPFVSRWQGNIINVHHSFLPAFVGANAYRQARDRGVKMVGATAHYVTSRLDQGPIIEQDVTRVSHRDTLEDVVRKGRDLERATLTRAVRLHLARRIIISDDRTVVFA
jgi:formyltetrahydrofolate deformylase